MDERFSLSNIAELLAKKTGRKLPETEAFLDELIVLINEGIRNNHIVKVRGIGVFKITLVKERESVHVNTGERIAIPEHHKLSFLPEKELKEMVNKPFSAFEATQLPDPVSPEIHSTIDTRDENEELDEGYEQHIPPPPVFVPVTPKPAKEPLLPPPPPKTAPEPEEEETVLIRNHPEEETVLLPPPTQDQTHSQDDTVLLTTPVDSFPPPPEWWNDNDDTVYICSEQERPKEKDEIPVAIPKKKKSLWPLYALLIFLIIILGGCIWYLFSDRTIPFFNHNSITVLNNEPFALPGDSTAIKDAQEKARLAVMPDSVVAMTDASVAPATTSEAVSEKTNTNPSSSAGKTNEERRTMNSPTPIMRQSNNANAEVIDKVRMTSGNRLTLIALEYYGNKIFWVYIYEYNKSKIGTDPNVVPVGMELLIPAKSVYGIDANSAASIEKARQRQAEIMSRNQSYY